MARYIDTDRYSFPTYHRKELNDYMKGWNTCLESVLQQPTADVKEVKYGEWVSDTHNSYRKFCNICGHSRPKRNDHEFASSTNYCPNCGADMRGK